jgi:hypothetical protein
MTGLAQITQADFAAGVLRGPAPDVQPGVGVYNAINGLYNDDADIYRRGGTRAYGTGTLGGPITFMWSGFLANAPVILLATATTTYTLDASAGPVHVGDVGMAVPGKGAVVMDKLYLPNGYVWDGATYAAWTRPAALPAAGPIRLAAVAGRLVVAAGNRVAFSEANNPASFVADDYHELPGGVQVMGLMALRDELEVFTNFGLWAITNMAYDLTDAAGNIQQTLSLTAPQVSLWDEAGLAEWAGQIVAPCTDRCYLIGGVSAPTVISDSIVPIYMAHIRAGYRPGDAKVFRNHFFLPILDGVTPVAALVCRLNRPVRGRLLYYPWSSLTGHPARALCSDIDLRGAAPRHLLGLVDGTIADFTDAQNPDTLVARDADGSVFEFDVETRDFLTGNGQPNHVRRLSLRYTLKGTGQIQAGYSFGSAEQLYQDLSGTYADVKAAYQDYLALAHGPGWGSGIPPVPGDPERLWYKLDAATPPSPGIDPVSWRLPQARRVRFVRWRFRCTDPVDQLVLHQVSFDVRSAAHTR